MNASNAPFIYVSSLMVEGSSRGHEGTLSYLLFTLVENESIFYKVYTEEV